MIFDSVYDTYRGVVTYVRVVDGMLHPRERIQMMSTRATPRTPRNRRQLPGADAVQGPRRRRGRLPDHRRERRPPVQGGRHGHQPGQAGHRIPRPATPTPSPWSSPASTRLTARTIRYCATRWTSSSSTTPPWSTNRRPPPPSASDSASASWACCTWKSPVSGSKREFNLDLISTAPNVVYEVTLEDKKVVHGHQPQRIPRRARSPRSASRWFPPPSLRPTSSSAPSWSCARAAAASWAAWTTSPRTAWRCATGCRWPRSSSTSSTI